MAYRPMQRSIGARLVIGPVGLDSQTQISITVHSIISAAGTLSCDHPAAAKAAAIVRVIADKSLELEPDDSSRCTLTARPLPQRLPGDSLRLPVAGWSTPPSCNRCNAGTCQ